MKKCGSCRIQTLACSSFCKARTRRQRIARNGTGTLLKVERHSCSAKLTTATEDQREDSLSESRANKTCNDIGLNVNIRIHSVVFMASRNRLSLKKNYIFRK